MSSHVVREHGGNVAAAALRYGVEDMVDLSTGISPVSYPASPVLAAEWQALPTEAALGKCLNAARRHYIVPEALDIMAGPGTQALLQMVPTLLQPDTVWIKQPTYNEHVPAWQQAGHEVCDGGNLPANARHAVIVAPNNPTGEAEIDVIVACAAEIHHRKGMLLIDGAFSDGVFGEALLAAMRDNPSVIHLRSFGKFFGMAGLRLGFAIGRADLVAAFSNRAGPWAVNAAALRIGAEAMADQDWVDAHHKWLACQTSRLAALLRACGLKNLGGTCLFQTIEDRHAHHWHEHLAQNGIWTRIYGDYPMLLRVGLPGNDSDWRRLETALGNFKNTSESV